MRPLSLTVTALALAALTAACNRGTPTAQDRAATLVTAVTSVHADADASSLSNFVAHITGASEVPPRDTRGVGELKLQLSPDGNTLEYHLISSNIRNVVASHIHLAPTGVNGPIVVFLFGSVPPGGGRTDGVLASGTITAANLIGPLLGRPLSDLIAAIRADTAYVNVHTNDGVPPINTGAGDFPGGEIRGQVRTIGPKP